MFVGRSEELESLNESYDRGDFQFPVIYGRRRVGKTTLINEFCRGKKAIYFVAVQSTAKENLEILSAQIMSALAPGAPVNPFPSFRAAIDYVFEQARTERIVFAIDEYPYLASSDSAVSSILQAAIDKHHADSRLFLILCGSSMSFMEAQVLGYESPLYGRRTAQFKLLPFDYLDSAGMLRGYSNEEKITLYGITGGIPEYLSRIDTARSVRENVQRLFFNPAGRLFEEPSNLLKQELKMPETYNAIIAAIAYGSSKLNQIATKAGIETSQCSKMLSTLTGLGLVRKEHPITEEKSKKTIYLLDDRMFIFWYRFVLPELSRITSGLGQTVCDEVFAKHIDSHTGRAFEECAKQYMWRMLKIRLAAPGEDKRLPISFKRIGRWWGTNTKERREEEIDFIAIADDSAMFGECKWRNEQAGVETLSDLTRRSQLFSGFSEVHHVIFSKSGFTDALIRKAEEDGKTSLIDPEKMFADPLTGAFCLT